MYQLEEELSDNEFQMLARYVNCGENEEDNVRRAELLGFGGRGNRVSPGCTIRIPHNQMGSNIHCGLFSYINGNVTIGDNTLIGPHTTIAAGNHKFDPTTGWFSARSEPDGDDSIVIGAGSWIASNCVITGGVKLGKCNMVCAGAVVTHSTPDYSILAGIPAKIVGKIDPVTGKYLWDSHR